MDPVIEFVLDWVFSFPPCLLSIFRWVWRSVQRPSEAYWEKGNPRGHQDFEGGLLGEAEEGLSVWGVDHGPVWPAEHHQIGGRGHQEQAHNDHHRVHGERSARFISQGKYNTLTGPSLFSILLIAFKQGSICCYHQSSSSLLIFFILFGLCRLTFRACWGPYHI